METTIESKIAQECAAGNWENFSVLYDEYLPKIYRFIYYRTRHKQIAEDLTSTIFLKLVQNFSSFRSDVAPFPAWLYRISRNTLIDHTRVSKPTLDLEQAQMQADKQNVADEVDTTIKLEVIRQAMAKLSEQQYSVVTMRVWDNLTHKEISEILEISEDSSKVAFSRAVTRLKQEIEIV